MADIELYKGKYTGSEVDEFLRRIDNGVIISQSDKERYDAYATEIANIKNSFNCIGEIKAVLCSANYAPDGCVICNGQEYSKTDYQQLWTNYLGNGVIANAKLKCCSYSEYSSDISTYGQCAKIGIDATNGKFKVPTIKDGSVIQQANSNGELGKSYNAGLPNITGSFELVEAHNSMLGLQNPNGSIYGSNSGSITWPREGADLSGNYNRTINLNASRSSSIYGRSNTVQPQAVAVRYFIALYNGVYNESQLNLAEMMAKLDKKAGIDLDNISNNGKNVIKSLAKDSSMGMPNYAGAIDISSQANGQSYTQNSNGYLYIYLCPDKQITIGGKTFWVGGRNYNYESRDACIFPLPKNTLYSIPGGNIVSVIYFIPCL